MGAKNPHGPEALAAYKEETAEQRKARLEQRRVLMEKVFEKKAYEAKSYNQISQELGISPNMAWRCYQAMLEIMNRMDYKHQPRKRAEAVARIERIMDSLLPQILGTNGLPANTDLIEQYNKLDIQRSKLLGLYAPVKVKMDHRSQTNVTVTESGDDANRKLFALYERLKKRGKITPGDEERFRRAGLVEGEIVGEEEATKGPSVSGEPSDISLNELLDSFPESNEP